MDIQIMGINDRCEYIPKWINEIGKSYLLLTELPITNDTARSVFSLLNSREEKYFSSENKFIERVNNYFDGKFGFKVNPMILDLIYRTKDNYVLCHPIGCIDEFNYENKEVDNILRFNRSVAITNNVLKVLKNHQETIDSKILEINGIFEKLSNNEYLRSAYARGNKIKFLEQMLEYYFLYSCPKMKESKPDISKKVLEEMINVSFDYSKDEKVYINPLTFAKSYYKIKGLINPQKVNILVGEPHRLFLEHFLMQKFPEVSSTSRTLDFLKTDENTPNIINDIRISEQERLIH
jgi:hypothetical protein